MELHNNPFHHNSIMKKVLGRYALSLISSSLFINIPNYTTCLLAEQLECSPKSHLRDQGLIPG